MDDLGAATAAPSSTTVVASESGQVSLRRRASIRGGAAAASCALALLFAPGAGDGPRAATAATSAKTKVAVVLAAGDIASCRSDGDEQTAAVLARQRGTILTLGDNAYESGTAEEFARCYGPSWGRFKRRTRPSAGNHDYKTARAAPFLAYFGLRRTYYAFDAGAWRLYALDSEDVSPEQLRWLRRDLRVKRRRCILAYWHRPRFSSGPHGDDASVAPFWAILYDARADVVLNGHDHDYERFATQDPGGERRSGGIRQFVVGTGGRSHYRLTVRRPNSEVFDGTTFGVLRLELRRAGYRWRFLPAGGTFTDSGSGRCTRAPARAR